MITHITSPREWRPLRQSLRYVPGVYAFVDEIDACVGVWMSYYSQLRRRTTPKRKKMVVRLEKDFARESNRLIDNLMQHVIWHGLGGE